MHTKSDSDVTSVGASSPARPLYYVQSPSNHDAEKMSYGSSPFGSPHHYHCSPIHHSRESSTSRFSASLKTSARNAAAWKRLQRRRDEDADGVDEEEDDEYDEDDERENGEIKRFYVVCFVLSFIVLFSIFSLILWAASTSYPPEIFVKRLVFESFSVQSGTDRSGVPTDMLTLNSTIKIFYRNRGTFFGVHVRTTPIQLLYYQRHLATGFVAAKAAVLAIHFITSVHKVEKFYQHRKSRRTVVATILAHQVPLYGAVPVFTGVKGRLESISVPLNLTFGMRSRAYVLGKLVKPKFYSNIRCEVTLSGNRLGKPVNLKNSCVHHS